MVFCGSIEGKAGNRCFPTSRDRRTVFDTEIDVDGIQMVDIRL